MLDGVSYQKIDDEGLWYSRKRKEDVLNVDTIIICAGQEPLRELNVTVQDSGARVHLIGGALEARELDAKRAINQGSRLAAKL